MECYSAERNKILIFDASLMELEMISESERKLSGSERKKERQRISSICKI